LVHINWGAFDKRRTGPPLTPSNFDDLVTFCLKRHNIVCKCNILDAFREILGSQKLFISQTGRLGIGPGTLRTGDELWVVNGSEVSFLLRGLEGSISKADTDEFHRTFVGDGYVHDGMQGELLVEDGVEKQPQVLVLH
jgi:hypothetical protein